MRGCRLRENEGTLDCGEGRLEYFCCSAPQPLEAEKRFAVHHAQCRLRKNEGTLDRGEGYLKSLNGPGTAARERCRACIGTRLALAGV